MDNFNVFLLKTIKIKIVINYSKFQIYNKHVWNVFKDIILSFNIITMRLNYYSIKMSFMETLLE